jgi:D-alanyl-D-alanine carboxypeptidase
MNRRMPLLGALLATAALAVAGCTVTPASPSPSPSPTASAAFADALAGPLEAWRASPQAGPLALTIPGTVVGAALGDGDPQLAASGIGAPGASLSTADTFHIGSVTKLFTAALVMQLDEEGILSLDDTIDRWLPKAPNGAAITVRMLLEHTSGLYELDYALVGNATPQEIIDQSFTNAPISAPGTAYQYLNAGYLMLGRIAELAAGTPYGDLVRTRFIEPLGLTSTYLDGEGKGPHAVNGFELRCGTATGLECAGKQGSVDPVTDSPQWTGAWAAGGIVSNARDQAVWIRALVAGDVVDAAHKQLMRELTPLSSTYYSDAYAKAGIPAVQLGEGTGLASWAVPGVGDCFGHAGSIPGSNGIVAYCPDAQLSIVVLNAIDPAGATPGYPGLLDLAPVALAALQG